MGHLIAGIDYSSHYIDVVLVDHQPHPRPKVHWRRYALRGQDAFERARDVREAAPAWGEWWWNAVGIGLEEPRGVSPGPIYRVQGAILACLPRNSLVQPWIPSAWRKAVGLKGNCSKGDVAEFVHAHLGAVADGWPQDACDAWCIAEATRLARGRSHAGWPGGKGTPSG